jgi:flagellar protein FlaJ
MKQKKQGKLQVKWKAFVAQYKTFCYQFLGKKIEQRMSLENTSEKLKMANMRFTPGIYLSTIIITGMIVTIISLLSYTVIFLMLINSSSWLIYVLILTAITSGFSFGFFPFVVSSRISTRKRQIDHEMPFILSELSILASTGLTPIKIMRRIAQRSEDTAVNVEFKKIIYKIDVKGKDLISAISETAKETPSPIFRETLWDIGNMIHQGGDLDEYLRTKADMTLQLKRDIQKEFIDKLGTYSEMYMSLVLTGVLFLGIAAFLLDAMSSEIAGLDANSLLLLLSYGFVPVTIIIVNVVISMAYSKKG